MESAIWGLAGEEGVIGGDRGARGDLGQPLIAAAGEGEGPRRRVDVIAVVECADQERVLRVPGQGPLAGAREEALPLDLTEDGLLAGGIGHAGDRADLPQREQRYRGALEPPQAIRRKPGAAWTRK